MPAQTFLAIGSEVQMRLLHLFRLVFSASFWKAVAFLVLSAPLGVFWFCLLLPLITISFATTIIWVGLLLLAGTMWL